MIIQFPGSGISASPQIEGQPEALQFRYSKAGFRRNLVIAIGLTLLICGLTWLLLGIYGSNHMNLLTIITGLCFFAFISARMLAQYFRNEIILAVQPTGIYDGRISDETIAWEKIKELVLIRREQDYSLSVILWPGRNGNTTLQENSFELELSVLEGGSEKILDAIQKYMPIRMER